MKLTPELKQLIRFYLESTNPQEVVALNEALTIHGFDKQTIDTIDTLYGTSGLKAVFNYLKSNNETDDQTQE